MENGFTIRTAYYFMVPPSVKIFSIINSTDILFLCCSAQNKQELLTNTPLKRTNQKMPNLHKYEHEQSSLAKRALSTMLLSMQHYILKIIFRLLSSTSASSHSLVSSVHVLSVASLQIHQPDCN